MCVSLRLHLLLQSRPRRDVLCHLRRQLALSLRDRHIRPQSVQALHLRAQWVCCTLRVRRSSFTDRMMALAHLLPGGSGAGVVLGLQRLHRRGVRSLERLLLLRVLLPPPPTSRSASPHRTQARYRDSLRKGMLGRSWARTYHASVKQTQHRSRKYSGAVHSYSTVSTCLGWAIMLWVGQLIIIMAVLCCAVLWVGQASDHLRRPRSRRPQLLTRRLVRCPGRFPFTPL